MQQGDSRKDGGKEGAHWSIDLKGFKEWGSVD